MKKFFLVLTFVLLATVTGIGLLVIAWLLHWPFWLAWLGPVVFLVIPGLYLLSARLIAWREKSLYAKNVLNQKPELGPTLAPLDPLSARYQEFVKTLGPAAQRALKGQKWTLVFGEPLITTALASPNLPGKTPSLRDPLNRVQEDLDFAFFAGQVVVEVPGVLSSEGQDLLGTELLGPEISRLISLLKDVAPQGLGAVIFSLPDRLLSGDAARALNRLALKARWLIQELSLALDTQLPVWVLLGGSNLVANPISLGPLATALERANQPGGITLAPGEPPVAAANRFVSRLKELFSWVFYAELTKSGLDNAGPVLQSLPSVNDLPKPLTAFLERLTGPAWQGPSWNGPVSLTQPPIWVQKILLYPPTDPREESLAMAGHPTLARFFQEDLLASQALAKPLGLPGSKRQRRFKLAFGLYYAALLILCLAFLGNVRHNRAVFAAFSPPPTIAVSLNAGEPAAKLDQVYERDRFLDALNQATAFNFLPRLGPDPAKERLNAAQNAFFRGVEDLSQTLLDSLALGAQNEPQAASNGGPPPGLALLRQLFWLAGTFRLGLRGDTRALENQLSVFPAWPQDLSGPGQGYWNLVYGEILVDYFKRKPPKPNILRGLSRIELLILKAAPGAGSPDLSWLLDWAGVLPEVQPVTLTTGLEAEVFSAIANRARLATVPAAYTKEGRTAIKAALEELSLIHLYPQAQTPNAAVFLLNYDQDYLAQWRAWGLAAAAIAPKLTKPGELTAFTDNVFKLMNDHLSPLMGQNPLPAFVHNLELEVAQTRLHGGLLKPKSESPGGLAGIMAQADYIAADAANLRDFLSPGQYRDSELVGRIMGGSQPYKDYQAALAKIDAVIQGNPDDLLALARTHFGGPGYGDQAQSPLTLAALALDRYLAFFYQGSTGDSADPVKELVKARLKNRQTLLIQKTAQTLDRKWASEVVDEVRFLEATAAQTALYSPNGLLDKFLTDWAAPFLNQKGQLYRPATWRGVSFPFNDDFLRLLSLGKLSLAPNEPLRDLYPVKITVLAARVNLEAREKPQKAVVTLKAPEGATVLENYNYPTSKVFDFKPGVSGNVLVEIVFPSLTLALSYEGREAFAYFVKDLLSGELTLTRGDFPQEAEILANLGVTQITLSVETEGALPILKFVEMAEAPSLPSSIIRPIEPLN